MVICLNTSAPRVTVVFWSFRNPARRWLSAYWESLANSKKSQRTFELLNQEVNTFARSMLGVGMELPAWLAALEHEVAQYFLPERLKDKNLLDHWVEPVILPLESLREQLEKLPGNKLLEDEPTPPAS